ncbi:MAG: hypothetical protein AABX03_03340 [Nanoarchaeota archaeon]
MEHNLVGYGSLLSHKSLKETINNKHFKPVIVKGYKRIFNIAVKKEENFDELNLEKSKKSKFNGVMFKVNEDELEKINKREREYNLEEVEVYDFKTGKRLGKSLVVVDYFIKIDRKNKLPSKSYFILCRQAAYHISKEFGKYWDKTSFISDEERVDKWIKNHKEYDKL